jgi:hypothetical protein
MARQYIIFIIEEQDKYDEKGFEKYLSALQNKSFLNIQ